MTDTIFFDLHETKETDVMTFSLNKTTQYVLKLFWESPHDIDAHLIALEKGRILGSYDRVLSTYNKNLILQEDNTQNIRTGENRPFCNKGKYLLHEGDVLSGISMVGNAQPKEVVKFDINALMESSDANKITSIVPVLTMHPPSASTFAEVKNAYIILEDNSGNELLRANLSNDFNKYNVVTLGMIVLDNNEWKFSANALGFNGDFNSVISRFA